MWMGWMDVSMENELKLENTYKILMNIAWENYSHI
jgi:hypothetical protein